MEAQLRRLWPRRKSFKKSTKPDTKDLPAAPPRSGFEYNDRYEATVSGPPPEVGSLPLKPSDNVKSKNSASHFKAQSVGLQEFRTVTDKDIHLRAKSTGGIQPMLIGISRPITSGSTQKDVMNARNSNGKPPPMPATHRLNTATSLPQPRAAQMFQPVVKRHVDVMSFAAANGKHLEGYNEEVAARNLNLKTLASESATTTSVTRSKYQEDVATRNAATMGYRYIPSAPTQLVPEDNRSNSLDGDAALHGSVIAPLATYRHEGMSAPRKMRSVQQSSAHHSRNGSASAKTSTLLPAIPQEVSVEDIRRTIPLLDERNQSEAAQRRGEDAEPESVFTRYPSMHGKSMLEDSNQTTTMLPLPKTTTRANQSRPIANTNSKEYGHPLHSNPYEANITEYTKRGPENKRERVPPRRTGSKSSQHPGDDFSRRTGASSSRTSSADRGRPTSSDNYNASVGNRTFMDLTKDETERQSQYESPDTDYLESPVLAQATADTLHLHQAQLIGSTSPQHPGLVSPSDTEDNGASSKSLSTLNQQSKRWSSAYSDAGSLRSEQRLAFSNVTTVSSMSPASRPVSESSPAVESSRIARSRERTRHGSIPRDNTRLKTSDDRMTFEAGNTKPSTFYDDTPTNADYQQRNPDTAHSSEMVYTSPDSLNSGDFTDPSRAFGVLTRDFASTPSRESTVRHQQPRQKSLTRTPGYQTRPEVSRQTSQPITSQEQKQTPRRHLGYEHKTSGTANTTHELPIIREPSKSPQLDHVDTPVKELTASYFDEAEFARKQAQARAALLRLQMSLEEQYDTSPGRPDSSTQRHVARQILDQGRKPQSEDKKSSAPPTSMYYEKKEYQSRAKTNRPAPLEDTTKASSGYTYEKAGPNSFAQSVYSAVTIAPTSRPSTSGHTKSPSAGSASHSYNYANGSNTNSRSLSTLPNPPLTPVLPSPAGTEVSLSSFPMPQSPEHRGRRMAGEGERPRTARMHSTKSSVASIASVYSIPHHMVPARDSSRRDAFDEED
jgi:hypothetical protein